MTYGLVIASYKYGHLASQALESALAQSKKFDKIWFVDDGVGDCSHLPSLYPQIEYVLREKNLGTVANFQDMLERVDTDFVMFLGADNWLRSDTLELLSQSNCDIITYDIIVTGEDKDEIIRRHPREIRRHQGDWYWDRSSGHHGSMLYNVSKAKEVGYKRSNGSRTEEDMMLYQGMLQNGATRQHIPEALLFYRRHKHNFNQ